MKFSVHICALAVAFLLPTSAKATDNRIAPPPGSSIVIHLTRDKPHAQRRHHARRHHSRVRHAKRAARRGAVAIRAPEPIASEADRANIFTRYALAHEGNAPTGQLPSVLQAKLGEIQNACTGFKVISTVCGRGGHSWNVAGTGHVSLHCLNRAADFKVTNYSCAYSHLKDWRGGLSGDAKIMKHVHLSTGGREGRFCHHGRYASGCMFARSRPSHYGHHGRRHYAGA